MTTDMGLAPLKPKLRGWLHAAMLPLSLAAGIVLVIFAPTQPGKIGGAVFLAASVLLFGTSAIYHRFSWGTKGSAILRRMDHANIFIFIAATYTPMALLLLDGADRWWLLGLVWGAAILGLLSRIFWLSAPRWFYTLLYLAVGWAAVGWLKPFWDNGGPLVVGLIIAGGLLYSLGALVYARKAPNPSPQWFGFHEIFHLCTVLAFACHYAAISVAAYSA
ncbi:hemolysin III family protein [Naumannella halotolerans]|uniref:PAQR family membrane homeostasis protein TrhA n=1 Tax=Naumannella halotolerans TaxID=993414 RepID=UPI00370D4F2F